MVVPISSKSFPTVPSRRNFARKLVIARHVHSTIMVASACEHQSPSDSEYQASLLTRQRSAGPVGLSKVRPSLVLTLNPTLPAFPHLLLCRDLPPSGGYQPSDTSATCQARTSRVSPSLAVSLPFAHTVSTRSALATSNKGKHPLLSPLATAHDRVLTVDISHTSHSERTGSSRGNVRGRESTSFPCSWPSRIETNTDETSTGCTREGDHEGRPRWEAGKSVYNTKRYQPRNFTVL